MGKRVIRQLRHKPGLLRRIGRCLAYVAIAIYALAPAVPLQAMPYYMMQAMPGGMAGMGHMAMGEMAMGGMDMSMPGMSGIPPEAFCPNPGMADKDSGAKPSGMDDGGCPICKVAGTVMVLASLPVLPLPGADFAIVPVFARWQPPSQRLAAAQPRGPPV